MSPVYGGLDSTCDINFAYHKSGSQGGYLRLYLIPPGVQPNSLKNRTLIWSVFGNQGNQWNTATAGIGRRQPGYRLVFESIHIQQSGDMAIDDVTFNHCALGTTNLTLCAPNQFHCKNGACIDTTLVCDFSDDCGDKSDELACSKYVQRCNFENNICNWIQDDTSNFHWSYTRGKTATTGTGPSYDHTLGNSSGHYIFIETSSPRVPGDKARLKSAVFSPTTTGMCVMRFFYHMHGTDINALNIYIEKFERGPRMLIWNLTGSQPDEWRRGSVSLNSNTPFRILIEGVRGNGYHGDIAIDDISFTPGCQVGSYYTLPIIHTTPNPQCGTGKLPCSNGVCIPWNNFCNFKKDCSDGSDEVKCPSQCNFEGGNLCHWTEDKNVNAVNWTIGMNKNPSGPGFDHTTGNSLGHYAYITPVGRSYRQVGRLLSPIYNQAGKTCNFSLWYNNNGTNVRLFRVLLKRGSSENELMRITSSVLNSAPGTWKPLQVLLPICAANFQIVLEATAYKRNTGYIAIDDLQFGQCQLDSPPNQCLLGQFSCKSGHCVPENLKCDFQTDCCDGTDEGRSVCSAYKMCSFDYNMCGWQQKTNDQFDWQRHRGPTSSFGTGPSADHTTGGPSGFFLYIETSRPQKPNDTARIYYNMPAQRGPCAIRFWYHMYGRHVGSLNVYMATLDYGTILLDNITSSQGNKWLRKEVALQSKSVAPYQVIIEGVVGPGYLGDIAIDDLTFTPGCGIPTTGIPPTVNPSGSTFMPNNCPSGQFQCVSDKKCINASQVCNFRQDCTDRSDEKQCPSSCDFETNTCGWNETPKDGFDWARANGGQTQNLQNMAPRKDNTFHNQNGYYMYIKDTTQGSPRGLNAVLKSPVYMVANSDCKIMFSYYTNGQHVGFLYLKLMEQGQTTTLWRQSKSMGDQWNRVTVGIGRRSNQFMLMFSKTTYSYQGITAVDDIQFKDCSMLPPVNICNTNYHFFCTNRVCIKKSQTCDLTDDCGDGSDEAIGLCSSYKRYNFESGIGDLMQGIDNVDDNFNWTLWSGKTPTTYTGPLWDHTFGTSVGHYMYMESSQQKYNQKAWLVTKPYFRTNGRNCVMRMYYFMSGIYVNQLNVYYRLYNSGPPTKLLFSRTGDQGAFWQRIDINLNVSASFQVVIEAKVGDSFLGDIAIDDLSFTPDCQYDGTPLPTPPTHTGVTVTTVKASHTKCNSETQFSCASDGSCINKVKMCDFRADCNDTSDETNCVKPQCFFNNGDSCGWTLQATSTGQADQTYKWKIDSGNTVTSGDYRPPTDATQKSSQGYYVWADSSRGSYNDHTELKSPVISKTGPQCTLVFSYWMEGPTLNSLSVITRFNNHSSHLYSIEGNHGASWQIAEVFIGPRENFRLIIQAKKGRSFRGDISVDNIIFQNCAPPEFELNGCKNNMYSCMNGYCINPDKQCDYADDCGDASDEDQLQCDQVYKGRCNFEHGICPTWFNEKTDDFDWSLSSSRTMTIGTGPLGDHTTRRSSGTFLYIESSSPRKPGQKARLASYIISGLSQNCQLRFWSHMYGSDIGTLAISKRYSFNAGGLVQIGSISGNQGDFWAIQKYDVSNTAGDKRDYEVIIEGSIGNGYHGDIAIDDISMTPGCERSQSSSLPGKPSTPAPTHGPCGADRYICRNNNCYGESDRCNFVDNCGDNTDESNCGTACTFESGLCGWTNSINDNADWKLQQGPTASKNTGPSTDHTVGTNTGHYMYVESSSPSRPRDKAELESSVYYESSPTCNMTFWYNMYGQTMGVLKVLVKTQNGQIQTLWKMNGNQGQAWKQASVPLPSYHKFSIAFEALAGTSYLGDMAIDDISFNNCQPAIVVKSCPDSQFRCSNGLQCIERRYRCDERTDCNDGSDEDNCQTFTGDCSFDQKNYTNACSWTQSKDDDADWKQGQYTPNANTGPSVDHRGTANGLFLYIDSSTMRSGDAARILTPYFPPSRGVCYVRFWYYMSGSPYMGPLRVYVYTNDSTSQLWWSKSGSQGQKWNYVNLLLGSSRPFRVMFEGIRGDEPQSDIAIDDVSFTRECSTGKPYVVPTGIICDRDSFLCAPKNLCYPNSWKCDGVIDCPNGVDEPPTCPTTPLPTGSTPKVVSKNTVAKTLSTLSPTTPHSTTTFVNLCGTKQFRCSNGDCLAKLYYCDGVADCKDGSDEPPTCLKCHKGYYYCKKLRQCINSPRCDGVDDCGDGTDESLCGLNACPPNFCQNGGICNAGQNQQVNCNCSGAWYGDRCQTTLRNVAPPKAQTSSGSGWKAGVGVTVGLLAVLAIVVAGYFVYKRRIARSFEQRMGIGLDNPSYDSHANDDFHMNDLEPAFQDSHFTGSSATSIENPLYQDMN